MWYGVWGGGRGIKEKGLERAEGGGGGDVVWGGRG